MTEKNTLYSGRKTMTEKQLNEPQREKTYFLTCSHNEDSNKPVHPRSLSRVFVVHMKKLAFLAIQNTPSEDSGQTARTRMLIYMSTQSEQNLCCPREKTCILCYPDYAQ